MTLDEEKNTPAGLNDIHASTQAPSPGHPQEDATVDETLPLHSECVVNGDSSTVFLEKDASADDIREYLSQILVSKYRVGIDEARRVALKWGAGTVRELKQYPPHMFLELFGPENGWLLYKQVKMGVAEQENKNSKSSNRDHAIISLILFAMSETAGTSLVLSEAGGFMFVLGLVLIIVVGMFFLFITLALFFESSPEEKAENELRLAMSSPQPPVHTSNHREAC
ncbi:hypothetical protein Tdes44962_MAKER01511 [Teratosphaeria destructans]|uniref:Uncharacterized protein n=1 Tax=Teratosphaeria destructans TaxID=418781 RepID=A0A9W7SZE4_9PEZI|nr:hypothetical protein Tdes44962_MAKER01511 [Teratosphaeria destructans]